ncbi:hypothetical protein CPLU01_16071 [Colletotrichum plurivorum]|uniref:Uncharacterized protein n=1 Tax=Colletotrichum plurivorum TaxID=2175906 RepID=A0A8H6J0M2_9PEZI|nr:hypothetical protein CPLU01_16071 [Colletotrichum plurivorum]
MAQPPPTLSDHIASYPGLETLAKYVSAYDLFHLGITSQSNHANIIASRRLFERLRRLCICDGLGLAMRKNFVGPYESKRPWPPYHRTDDPIEVQLYNLKCDTADTLPCVRCGVNVCEECRDYLRWPDESKTEYSRE